MGLSGPEGGIGTDDIRYFERVVDVPIKVKSTEYLGPDFPFTTFLNIVYPFKIIDPLNIVIFNILGTTFLPSLTYIFCNQITNNSIISKKASSLILFCPAVWSNGLILMRDIWTVSLTIIIFILTIDKKYFLSIFPLVFLAYIRFGSVFFAILGVIIILYFQYFKKNKNRKFVFWSGICLIIISFFLLLNILIQLTAGKIEASFFRETFVNALIRDDADGILTRIAQLPVEIRTPLLFLFFYFTPFVKFKFFTLGVFNIRLILDTLFTGFWLIFIWKYIFKTIYLSFSKNAKYKLLTWISILLALGLGTVSLQVRHKVVMYPIFAIMAAIGINTRKTRYEQIFQIMAIFIGVFEILFALR